MLGKKEWVIPDGYMSDSESGNYISHEAVCVLNLTDEDANIKISIFFEDREPICDFYAVCKSKRANHIRLDKLVSKSGEKIPKEVCYATLIESDVDVIAQGSRMEVSSPDITLMTTIAY